MRALDDKKNQSVSVRLGAAACICLLVFAQATWANPTGGVVKSGTATITNQGNTTTINQTTNKAIINWQDFSIGAGETTQFIQPSTASMTLNRVIGSAPSQIYGALKSNGTIYIINGNGILFGQNATVDVGGLVATTSQISDQSFLKGTQQFTAGPNPNASVINEGSISVRQAGLVVLVAPTVINHGVISANLGTVHLASGDHFTVDLYGDGLISLDAGPQATKGLVENSGTIKANGGRVFITAQAADDMLENVVNMTGYIDASSATAQGGKVVLQGYGNTQMNVDGQIDVSSANNQAGVIQATASTVNLGNDSLLNASGYLGGGTINIGGEYQGGGTLAHADYVNMDAGSQIYADALNTGNGGLVTLWSDQNTNAYGSIYARGGSVSGNGGFVETSSHNTLDTGGITVSVGALQGLAGNWFIDPTDLTITDTDAGNYNTTLAGGGNVTISTSGIVTFDNTSTPIDWSTAANFSVRSNSGALPIGNTPVTTLEDSIQFNPGALVSSTGAGNIDFFYNPAYQGNPLLEYTVPTDFVGLGYVSTTGSGVFNAYMEVNTPAELNEVRNNLSGSYALNTNIDASSLGAFTEIGTGFPAAYFTGKFTGKIQDDQYTISNLTISQGASPSSGFGLFGYLGNATLSNIYIADSNITGSTYTGAIAGFLAGTTTLYGNFSVSNTSVTSTNTVAGGLFGYIDFLATVDDGVTMVNDSSSTVTAPQYAGGLVGVMNAGTNNAQGTFSNAATVTATLGQGGGNYGQVTSNISNNLVNTGTVTDGGSGATQLGGNVGFMQGSNIGGSMTNSGNVTGSSGSTYVGGNIGELDSFYTVENLVNSGGTIQGDTYVGGNIGWVKSFGFSAGIVNDVIVSNTTINGIAQVGGSVGRNQGFLTNATVTDTNTINTSGSYTGGITGYQAFPGGIIDAISGATINASGDYVGGIVGFSDYNISNVVSVGPINAPSATYRGQIAGWNDAGGTITNALYDTTVNSFSTTNGVGFNSFGTITNSLGKTTSQLSVLSTYTDNGFSAATWQLFSGYYASLIWCGTSCLIPIQTTPTPSNPSTVAQTILTQVNNAQNEWNTTINTIIQFIASASNTLNIVDGNTLVSQMNIDSSSPYYQAVSDFMDGVAVVVFQDNTTDIHTAQEAQDFTTNTTSDAVQAEAQARGCAGP